MAIGGYVKLYRSLLDWEWWGDASTTVLFIYLLIKANINEGRFRGTVIPRGSLVCSLQTLSDGTGLSVQSVRTALEHLESTQEVTRSKVSKYTVLTVKNYEKYQQGNTEINKQLTSNQQATNKQSTQSKEDKNNKNNKNINNIKAKSIQSVVSNEGASYDVGKATADATAGRPTLRKKNPATGQMQACYFDKEQNKLIFI